MTSLWWTITGLLRLSGLFLKTGCRLGHPYWTWRMHTAFRGDAAGGGLSRGRVREILGYAQWTSRMERLSK